MEGLAGFQAHPDGIPARVNKETLSQKNKVEKGRGHEAPLQWLPWLHGRAHPAPHRENSG